MPTTKEIIASLRACAGDDYDCAICAYNGAGVDHCDRLHLDAAAELERLDRKLTELRQFVVDNIGECREARDTYDGQLRDQLDGCVTALGCILRWMDEGVTDEDKKG